MKTLVLAATLMLGSGCFAHGYDRYDRYDRQSRYDRYDRSDRYERNGQRRHRDGYRGRGIHRSSPPRGAVLQRLPPGASREVIRGQHYARVGDAVLRWDGYRGGWVVIR